MKWILPFAVSCFCFFGCTKNNNGSNPSPQKSNGLMPLSVGNYWQYNKISYDSSTGVPIDTVLDEIDIIGQVTLGDTTYFQQTQTSITNIHAGSFFINIDSNTVDKIDSGSQYTFFKRVNFDSSEVDTWADTVTSRCQGHNFLYGFTGTTSIDGHDCLRNIVYVNDCTGTNFEQWVYYLQPGLGLVRILHYVLNSGGNFYLQFSEDLKQYHTN